MKIAQTRTDGMICVFYFDDFFNMIIMHESKIHFLSLFCVQVFERIILCLIIDFCKDMFEQTGRDEIFKFDPIISFDKSVSKK